MAGDAVHLFTPQGGFGMNTGVDDAANLAWKLAALVQGWGGPALLETYERERRPIAVRNTRPRRQWRARSAMCRLAIQFWRIRKRRRGPHRGRRTCCQNSLRNSLRSASNSEHAMTIHRLSPAMAVRRLIRPDEYIPSASPGGRAPHFWLPGRVLDLRPVRQRIYAPMPAAKRTGCRRFANGCGKAPDSADCPTD